MIDHFLHISDYSTDDLWDILKLAKKLKQKFRDREEYKIFNNKSLAMIFAKPSARTRVSFETGFEWMGGHALFLGPNDIGIGKREAIKDISRLLPPLILPNTGNMGIPICLFAYGNSGFAIATAITSIILILQQSKTIKLKRNT